MLRPFLDGSAARPWLLAMTAAGQSALNLRGLDTVVILDARYQNVVERGRNVLTRMPLGANEILQMAGRVHGRVAGGEVVILSERRVDFESLRPTPPEFQLAGDAERVALTCAALGVDARDLELPAPLDRRAYEAALRRLEERGIVEGGALTAYGAEVQQLPVERPWAELLLHADGDLVPAIAVVSAVESLHRMTREERYLRGLTVPGSDHLTVFNVYAEAVNAHARLGEVYGLPRHVFDEEGLAAWAERRGVLVKAVEDAALGMASVYRALELELPRRLTPADDRLLRRFQDLLARVMPLDLVLDEEAADGTPVRVSRGSVCGTWGGVAGTIRHFAGRNAEPRAAIEGTQLPLDLVRRYARSGEAEVHYDPRHRRSPLVAVRRLRYCGFDLDREVEPLTGIPPAFEDAARKAYVEALMTGAARHKDARALRHLLERLGELVRRAGGRLAGADGAAVRAALGARLRGAHSLDEFMRRDLALSPDQFVSAADRHRLESLPSWVEIQGERCPLDYDVEDEVPVVRVRLREALARRIGTHDLPVLDRRVGLTVVRGREGAIRAWSVAELRRALSAADRPHRRRSASARRHPRRP